MSADDFTIGEVESGAANYMLGMLQMTVAGGDSITPEIWQKAIDATVAFQRRMAAYTPTTPAKACKIRLKTEKDRGGDSPKSATVTKPNPHHEGDL